MCFNLVSAHTLPITPPFRTRRAMCKLEIEEVMRLAKGFFIVEFVFFFFFLFLQNIAR